MMESVAIVTGGARGIGRGIALALARRGFALALADRLGAELDATVAEAAGLGVAAMALRGDVADHSWVLNAAASVLQRWGRVDVLVNNAGISQPKGLLDITEAEWDLTMDTNLKSQFSWCKA
ncbi:MAG: SDR family NAD(P)-dependent oxidoreductase, partial [Janthinobacterium lividum]